MSIVWDRPILEGGEKLTGGLLLTLNHQFFASKQIRLILNLFNVL